MTFCLGVKGHTYNYCAMRRESVGSRLPWHVLMITAHLAQICTSVNVVSVGKESPLIP